MSDSVRPHRWQPTRLPSPWNSSGKNTGVGCHFLLQCSKVKSESEVAQLYPTLSNPMDWSLPGSSIHGIFQARVLEWGAIAFFRVKEYRNFIFCGKIRCYFWPIERAKIWSIYQQWLQILKVPHWRHSFWNCFLSIWCIWGRNGYDIKQVNTTKYLDTHHVLWESITVTFGRFLCATFQCELKSPFSTSEATLILNFYSSFSCIPLCFCYIHWNL